GEQGGRGCIRVARATGNRRPLAHLRNTTIVNRFGGANPMQDTMTRPAVTARAQQPWRLNILGPVELCYESSPVPVSGTARDLLALLARRPGQEVDTAGIVASLWGGRPPDDAQNVIATQGSPLPNPPT